MKIAVISDIHGNFEALRAVLSDIANIGVEQIVCAGDIVDPLPESSQVLDHLIGLKIPCLLGNHEEYVLRAADGDPNDPIVLGPNWLPVRQVAESLSVSQLAALRALPLTWRCTHPVAGTLLVFHTSPTSTQSGWFTDETSPPLVEADLARDLAGVRMAICGHWHRVSLSRWDSCQLVSAGSVGMALNGKAESEYVLVDVADGEWRCEHRAVAYDRMAAWQIYRDSGWIERGGPTARLLSDELRLSVRRMSPFIQWWRARKDDSRPGGWPYSNAAELAAAIQEYYAAGV